MKNKIFLAIIVLLFLGIGICIYVIYDLSTKQRKEPQGIVPVEEPENSGENDNIPAEETENFEEIGKQLFDTKIQYIVYDLKNSSSNTLSENLKKSLVWQWITKTNAFDENFEVSEEQFKEKYESLFGENTYQEGSFENLSSCTCPKEILYVDHKYQRGDMTTCGCGDTGEVVNYEKTAENDTEFILFVRFATKLGENYYVNNTQVTDQITDWNLQKYVFDKTNQTLKRIEMGN